MARDTAQLIQVTGCWGLIRPREEGGRLPVRDRGLCVVPVPDTPAGEPKGSPPSPRPQALDLPQPPNVLGVSLGGCIALSLAALQPGTAGKVVAVASTGGGPNATMPDYGTVSKLLNPNLSTMEALGLLYPLQYPDGAGPPHAQACVAAGRGLRVDRGRAGAGMCCVSSPMGGSVHRWGGNAARPFHLLLPLFFLQLRRRPARCLRAARKPRWTVQTPPRCCARRSASPNTCVGGCRRLIFRCRHAPHGGGEAEGVCCAHGGAQSVGERLPTAAGQGPRGGARWRWA